MAGSVVLSFAEVFDNDESKSVSSKSDEEFCDNVRGVRAPRQGLALKVRKHCRAAWMTIIAMEIELTPLVTSRYRIAEESVE